jgi:hypothetical protein
VNHPPRETQLSDARTALRSATPEKRIRRGHESPELGIEVTSDVGLDIFDVQSGLDAAPKGEVVEAGGGEVETGLGVGVGEETGAGVVAALSA